MAVAVDQINTTPATVGAATTLDLTTTTVGSGANRYLYVVLSTEPAASAPSVKWDPAGANQSMTLLDSQADPLPGSITWVFGLVAPTSGNKTVRASWTGAADAVLSAACFTGVNQTGGATSCVITKATGANAATASNNILSAVGNYTMAAWSCSGSTNWGTFNQTQWFLSGATLSYVSAGASATGASSVSYTAVGPTSQSYAFVGANIVAAAAASTAPFVNNTDLPPRAPSPGAISLKTWTDPLKLNLIGKDQFFGPAGMGPDYDWPNPRGPIPASELRTWIDKLKYTLQSQDRFFGLAGSPQFDWPVPRGPAYPSDLRTFLNPLDLQLVGQDKFFGLAGSPQFDWPVPKAPTRSISLWTWAEPLKILLQRQDAVYPGGLQDQQFPNPPIAATPRAISLLTWIDPVKLQLAGQDAFYGLGGVPNFDWPNPRGPAPLLQAWTDAYHLTLNFVVLPFSQGDWPNPRKPAPLVLDWIDPLKVNLQGQDTFFGLAGAPQRDWPNPRRPAPLVQDWFVSYSQTLNIAPSPFVQTSWPNPAGPLYAIALRTWVDPFKGAGTDSFFGLGGIPQFDWPVPKGPTAGISLRTWTDPVKLQLASLDAFFGLGGSPQFNWPNPIGPKPLLQAWTDTLKLELAGQDKFFGLAGNPTTDWPVPKGFVPGVTLKTWIDPFKGQGTDSFFGLAGNPNHDWPNPRGSAPLLQAWVDGYKYTLNAIPAPFTQGDWPNPNGPTYAIALRTWLDPFKGVGTDTFYGLGGVPQFDWPNPTRAVIGLIPGIPPSTFYTSIVPPPPPPAPVDTSVPGPADGEDDEPYADIARRKWLEWSRNRRRRIKTAPQQEQAEPTIAPPAPRVAKRQLQDRDLLARNLERMRIGIPTPTTPASIPTPDVKEAVTKVVQQLRKIADDDDDDVTSFLLGDDF